MEACGACGSSIAWGPGSDWAGSGSGSPSRRIGGIGGRSLTLISFGNAEWLFFPRLSFRAFIIGRCIATEVGSLSGFGPFKPRALPSCNGKGMGKGVGRSAPVLGRSNVLKRHSAKCCCALPPRELLRPRRARSGAGYAPELAIIAIDFDSSNRLAFPLLCRILLN